MAARHHERSDLPFVGVDDRGVPNHWTVTPSGDPSQDYLTCYEYGCDALAFAEFRDDSSDLLLRIFGAIIKMGQCDARALGFFDAVSVAAVHYQHAIRTGHIYQAKPGALTVGTNGRTEVTPADESLEDGESCPQREGSAGKGKVNYTDPDLKRS